MRYVGGKARIAKWIRNHVIDVADEYRGMELTYVEPFVGSAAVLTEVVRKSRGRFSRFIANDIQPDLIRMWSALMDGWVPPEYVSREEHRELKNSRVPSALRGYAGFCCSVGGNFFSGHESREGTMRDGSPPERWPDYRETHGRQDREDPAQGRCRTPEHRLRRTPAPSRLHRLLRPSVHRYHGLRLRRLRPRPILEDDDEVGGERSHSLRQ